jgi:nicotinamidase-related amidase
MKRIFCALFVVLMVVSAAAGQEAKAPFKMKPALLVIDIQNAFLPNMSDQDKKTGLVYIDAYINIFRLYGHSVIRVYHTDPQYGPKPGTKEFEFPETTAIKPDDPKVIKTYGNAFNKTDLDKILKEKGVNTLFLCGLSSVGCVLATYEGAMDLDYNTFMLQGALIGPEAAWTKTVLEFTRTIDYGALKLLFDTAK